MEDHPDRYAHLPQVAYLHLTVQLEGPRPPRQTGGQEELERRVKERDGLAVDDLVFSPMSVH